METDLKFPNYDDYPVIEGWHCVDFFRKVRDKHYKEEHGLPCDEEIRYIEEARRNFNEQAAEWERKKIMQTA